ncbi:MAG: FAD-binding oxidoreductase [Acidimicrobiales bacterium]
MVGRDVSTFLAELREVLGTAHVVTDPGLVAPHVTDWTRRWTGTTPAVVRPGSIDEVEAVVAAARRHGVALVPQGGNTGLVAGATPLGGEVVVDVRRLQQLQPLDRAAAQVTAGAGVTLARLQAHAAEAGLALGVDLGARDTATVGGMVATNAGGHHVLRHGSMRSQVLGVEAVLGTGARVAVNLDGLVKDNTGYDLAGLLCGSEGTLGILTAARLRLVPAAGERVVAFLGFGSVVSAVDALPDLRLLPELQALELLLADGIGVVADHLGRSFPLDPVPPAVLLVEVAGQAPLGALDEMLARLGQAVLATAVATDPQPQGDLWRWREAHPEAAAALGLVHKADVTLPLARLPRFVAELVPVVEAAAPDAVTLVYGHLGDGNLHVNVVGPLADDDRAVDAVLGLTLAHGGSVSAEHGMGRAKVAWMARQRDAGSVAAMRAIKAALDPDGILNPGAVLA